MTVYDGAVPLGHYPRWSKLDVNETLCGCALSPPAWQLLAHLGRADHPPSGPLLEVFLPRLHIVGEAVDDPQPTLRAAAAKPVCSASASPTNSYR